MNEKIKFQDLGIPIGAHPGFSIDCVIFCFKDNQLHVLLNKLPTLDSWMLPGGMMGELESVDDAAYRILKTRTGLTDVFLKQFYLFGNADRTNFAENAAIVERNNLNIKYMPLRFISIGYFALVPYDKVSLKKRKNEKSQWVPLKDVPPLYGDHNAIVNKALNTLRIYVQYIPVVTQSLLSEKFTMSELRRIHEDILDKTLDRKNFQKKMLASGNVIRLKEVKDVDTYPKPILYKFDRDICEEINAFFCLKKV